MKRKTFLVYCSVSLFCSQLPAFALWARDVTFCGERIPIDNSFVANKLMNVIRQQIPYANLPRLRKDAKTYFPMIEYYLKKAGMPADLKYIPIIESGFRNATSKVGAQGFWQLMPETAREWGLLVNANRDERNDIYKSTIAALRELARNYLLIRRDHKVSSWVLTAASYNYGTGRLYKKIRAEGKNYFSMNLNPETALYVYKIIAIKELFEYPELYIKNFQYNVFNTVKKPQATASGDKTDFESLEVVAKEEAKAAPDDAEIKNITKPDASELKTKDDEAFKGTKLVSAEIVGKYRSFKDGDAITIELQENLQTLSGFYRKGTPIKGKGWIIDDRVHIDLGFGSDNVILYDTNSEQGVALPSLKKGEQVILRVQN